MADAARIAAEEECLEFGGSNLRQRETGGVEEDEDLDEETAATL
jgi:hypothetical protein